MATEFDVPEFGTERTVKNCPPFVDAMTQGFVIRLPVDIHVSAGKFTWDWDIPDSPLSFHFATQVHGSPLDEGRSVVKFINFWNIRTEPGWSVLFGHPPNRPDLPFQAFDGMVDTDAFSDLPVHFPSRWLDPDFEGVLEKGTPIVQGVPIKREALEISIETLDASDVEAGEGLKARLRADSNHYRNHLRNARPSVDSI